MEYLIDKTTSTDNTLQAAIGFIPETSASSMIEMDPYRHSTRKSSGNANMSAIDFSAGRGSTDADLRFHPKDKLVTLLQDQQDELREWLMMKEGKKSKKEFFKKQEENEENGGGCKRKADEKLGNGNWKKKLKKAIKSEKGLKTVMSILASEEKNN